MWIVKIDSPEIWRIRNREQNHGCCMCPKCYLWKCDGQCDLCEYHAPNTVSLDQPLPDGEGTLSDYIPDNSPSIEDIVADRQLLAQLIAGLQKRGCTLDGLTEINSRYDDWKTGKKERIPAFKMSIAK